MVREPANPLVLAGLPRLINVTPMCPVAPLPRVKLVELTDVLKPLTKMVRSPPVTVGRPVAAIAER